MKENENEKKIKKMINNLFDSDYIKEGWFDKETSITDSIIDCIKKCTSPRANKKNNSITEDDLKLIFKAFSLFEPSQTRVLILGQDPYPEESKACGLSFLHNIEKYPIVNDTLKNIFDAINNAELNRQDKIYTSPIDWATKNKVLLLNRALTFETESLRKQHIEIWTKFIDQIIQKLIKRQNNKLVIILWGKPANTIEQFKNNQQDNENKNILILRSSHPSNQGKNYCGNYQCKTLCIIPAFECQGKYIFEACNKFLGKENEIDWKGLLEIYNYK